MSVAERIRAVPALMEFPVPEGLRDHEKHEFMNPVVLVHVPSSVSVESVPVTPQRIDGLLDQLAGQSPGRDWAGTTLAWLHGREALSALQSARLGDLLWAGVEDGALPQVPQVRSVDYPKLPHPSEIDPDPRVKE